MSKKELNFQKFSVAKPVTQSVKVEEAVHAIHTPTPTPSVAEEKPRTIKISVNAPLPVYKIAKNTATDLGLSLNDYMIQLILQANEQMSV